MDENMGGYVEDADWGWRARQKGWNSVYTPVESVIHHEATSGYEYYSLKTFLLKRNTVYWFLKMERHFSAWYYVKASMGLGRIRLIAADSGEQRQRHLFFLGKLQRAFTGLLRGETLGDWFGPPIGPWENEHEL
jgi:GT2 family glycosyltransferase